MVWQLQEAKQRFSEVVRDANSKGPQVVTRHGEEVAVVISMDDYRRLSGKTKSFKDFLLDPDGPFFDDLDLLLERSKDLPRPVDLGD
jgi:prevent-host-death family protein